MCLVVSSGTASPITQVGYLRCDPLVWAEYTLFLLLSRDMVGKSEEEFTQASQLRVLAVTTGHQPLSSVEDQLCRGRVVVLRHGL